MNPAKEMNGLTQPPPRVVHRTLQQLLRLSTRKVAKKLKQSQESTTDKPNLKSKNNL